MGEETDAIHRYTDLPALLYLLRRKALTLLDPASWDDKNDSHFMSLYKEAKGLSCVAALCLSEADETYHHWRVFAPGSSGVRITFTKSNLLHWLSLHPQLVGKRVSYRRLLDVQRDAGPPNVGHLPFLKRFPYEQECEFRLLFESSTAPQSAVDFDFTLDIIRRITLSPWMNIRVSDSVKEVIRLIPECKHLALQRSTLISNDQWKAYGDSAQMS